MPASPGPAWPGTACPTWAPRTSAHGLPPGAERVRCGLGRLQRCRRHGLHHCGLHLLQKLRTRLLPHWRHHYDVDTDVDTGVDADGVDAEDDAVPTSATHVRLRIHPDGGVARLGAGAVWSDVYRELVPRNLTVMGGRVTGIGVGGFITGGLSFSSSSSLSSSLAPPFPFHPFLLLLPFPYILQ